MSVPHHCFSRALHKDLSQAVHSYPEAVQEANEQYSMQLCELLQLQPLQP